MELKQINARAGEMQVRLLRQMGSVGRLNVAFGLFDFARARLTAHFRARHPEWGPQQVQAAVCERLMRTR